MEMLIVCNIKATKKNKTLLFKINSTAGSDDRTKKESRAYLLIHRSLYTSLLFSLIEILVKSTGVSLQAF
jgi:hypothetical protein